MLISHIRFVIWGTVVSLTALGFGQLADALDPENRYPMAISKGFCWESQPEIEASARPYVPVVMPAL